MKVLARITGALTVIGLVLIGISWTLEQQMNPDPGSVAWDHGKAVIFTMVFGGSITAFFAAGTRRPGRGEPSRARRP